MKTSYTTRFPSALDTAQELGVTDCIALVLMIVGAINWGFVGAFGIDLVAFLFGPMTFASRVVYALVGVAGLYGVTMPVRLRQRH